MEIDVQDQSSERAELHFLAAAVDELMNALLSNGVLTREQLNQVEAAIAERTGTPPRAW